MTKYKVLMTKQAKKDRELVANIPAMKRNVQSLVELLAIDPYKQPPFYETLLGDMKGAYSRRINRQHRLVYTVDDVAMQVVLLRMWTHYEQNWLY